MRTISRINWNQNHRGVIGLRKADPFFCELPLTRIQPWAIRLILQIRITSTNLHLLELFCANFKKLQKDGFLFEV